MAEQTGPALIINEAGDMLGLKSTGTIPYYQGGMLEYYPEQRSIAELALDPSDKSAAFDITRLFAAQAVRATSGLQAVESELIRFRTTYEDGSVTTEQSGLLITLPSRPPGAMLPTHIAGLPAIYAIADNKPMPG
jgi:hypothetical protein